MIRFEQPRTGGPFDVFPTPDKPSAAADPIESGQARAIAIVYDYAPGTCYMSRKSLQRFVPCRRSMTEVHLNPVLLRHAIPTFGALKKTETGSKPEKGD